MRGGRRLPTLGAEPAAIALLLLLTAAPRASVALRLDWLGRREGRQLGKPDLNSKRCDWGFPAPSRSYCSCTEYRSSLVSPIPILVVG